MLSFSSWRDSLPLPTREQKKLTHSPSKDWPFPSLGGVLQDWRPFHLLPHCLPLLSILPFEFSSSLFLSLTYTRTGMQTPVRLLFWGASLPSSQSAISLIKSLPCLNTSFLGFIGLSCGEQSKLGLGNINILMFLFLLEIYIFICNTDRYYT